MLDEVLRRLRLGDPAFERGDMLAEQVRVVQERNWPRKAVTVKAFRAPGKRGLD
ncbi:hypothetical protein [Amycolatopsis taiwanensis]|uniref:Uncharacterized protein n=1 Tax=Amycolatopsis taiwanensis TaxID=342230 RepID=A0A9W6R0Z5_9PSEU|nr:hypothetical protein [Amycolatopsis taiwanensis]GLY67579.1 hypothetical protein Atai01_41980 [Amycolatopsis taiwanensis]